MWVEYHTSHMRALAPDLTFQRAVVPVGHKLPEGLRVLFQTQLQEALAVLQDVAPIMLARRHMYDSAHQEELFFSPY